MAMLIPRFSLRTLLAAMSAFALVAFVGSFAYQREPWAIAVSAGLASLFLALAVYALLYLGAAAATALTVLLLPDGKGKSPFAEERLPPRHAAPDEP